MGIWQQSFKSQEPITMALRGRVAQRCEWGPTRQSQPACGWHGTSGPGRPEPQDLSTSWSCKPKITVLAGLVPARVLSKADGQSPSCCVPTWPSSVLVGERDGERQRETERGWMLRGLGERDWERQRHRDRQRDRDRKRQTDRDRYREWQRHGDKHRETETQREINRDTQRDLTSPSLVLWLRVLSSWPHVTLITT